MRFISSVLSSTLPFQRGGQTWSPCGVVVLVTATLALRKSRCLLSSAARYNKAPKSDKVKLSHPLLAQGLRQLHFAPWQRR
jgi:hypothetical protein